MHILGNMAINVITKNVVVHPCLQYALVSVQAFVSIWLLSRCY